MSKAWVKFLVWPCLLFCLLCARGASAQEAAHLDLILVWGTDAAQSPDPTHKAVDDVLAARLRKSPYRWKHYFEVNRQAIAVPLNETKAKIVMSKNCEVDVKYLGKDRVEVRLYGEGKAVSLHKEQLPLVLAGSAKNGTAWLVVIRKTEPPPVVRH